MLKGKTIIELTDVKTGEVERHEDNNMVTNALAKIFQNYGYLSSNKMWSDSSSDILPIYTNMLGGLLLVNSNIEEDADNVILPATAKVTGSAVYGFQNSTTDTQIGSYNVTESLIDVNNKLVKFVYDFKTSQANGTIACACLTHKKAGYSMYGSATASSASAWEYVTLNTITTGSQAPSFCNFNGTDINFPYENVMLGWAVPFLIDAENDIVHYFKLKNATTVEISKRRGNLGSLSIFDDILKKRTILETQSITIPAVYNTGAYNKFCYDEENNDLYIIALPTGTSIAVNAGFKVIKISADDFSVTTYTMTNATGVAWYTNNSNQYIRCVVYNGYLYVLCGTSNIYARKLFKIQLTNSANVTEIDISGCSALYGKSVAKVSLSKIFGGRIWTEGYDSGASSWLQSYVINLNDNTILPTRTYGLGTYLYSSSDIQRCDISIKHNPLDYVRGDLDNIYRERLQAFTGYLATINNLAEPVVKTADKTMKVTYIIQEQGEEEEQS